MTPKNIIALHYKHRKDGLLLNIQVDSPKKAKEFIQKFDNPGDYKFVGKSTNFKEYCKIVEKYKN